MSTYDKVQLLEIRVKRAALLIEKQRAEIADLKDSIELIKVHNEELQHYADIYKQDEKLIDDSISTSLETLDSIEGLLDIDSESEADFDAAENFSGGEAENLDDELNLDDVF